jgi:hypothetical protein
MQLTALRSVGACVVLLLATIEAQRPSVLTLQAGVTTMISDYTTLSAYNNITSAMLSCNASVISTSASFATLQLTTILQVGPWPTVPQWAVTNIQQQLFGLNSGMNNITSAVCSYPGLTEQLEGYCSVTALVTGSPGTGGAVLYCGVVLNPT